MNKVFFLLTITLCVTTNLAYGKEITLKKGALRTIELDETAGTGYSWKYLASNPTLIVVEDTGFKAGKGLGASGKRRFTITGKAAGETNITFTYQRPWEKTSPAKTEIYTVTVE